MKVYRRIHFVTFYIFLVIFWTLFAHYQFYNTSWFVYLLIILLAIPFAWMDSKTMDSRVKQFQNNLLEEDPELGQPVLNRACMNHFRNCIADGGVGYLLARTQVFITQYQLIFPRTFFKNSVMA